MKNFCQGFERLSLHLILKIRKYITRKRCAEREKAIARNSYVRVIDKAFGNLNNEHTDGATLTTTIDETETKVDEYELDIFLGSPLIVETEVKIKIKSEPGTASPLPAPRLKNDNRTIIK